MIIDLYGNLYNLVESTMWANTKSKLFDQTAIANW